MISTYAPRAWQPSKGPKSLLIIGGIVISIGVISVVLGIVVLGHGVATSTKDESTFRDHFTAEIPTPGRKTVRLEAQGYDLVAIGNDLTDPGRPKPNGGTYPITRADFPHPTVTVTSQSGARVPVEGRRHVLIYSGDAYDLVSLNWIEIETPGTYVIETAGDGPVTSVGVGDANTWDEDSVRTAVGGGVLSILGFATIVPGVLLLIGGFVWRGVDRNRGRRTPGAWPPTGARPGTTLPPPPPPPSSSTSPPWEPPQSPIS